MELFTDICGEQVPINVEHVDFWLAEFIENWKCPKTYVYHTKGETARVPGDPHVGNKNFMIMGTRHYGTEHEVPFEILKFRHIKHTIYTLYHKTTVVTKLESVKRSDEKCERSPHV